MSTDPKDVDFDVLELLEQRKRNEIIEECARVAESYPAINEVQRRLVGAAIRALKDQK